MKVIKKFSCPGRPAAWVFIEVSATDQGHIKVDLNGGGADDSFTLVVDDVYALMSMLGFVAGAVAPEPDDEPL